MLFECISDRRNGACLIDDFVQRDKPAHIATSGETLDIGTDVSEEANRTRIRGGGLG